MYCFNIHICGKRLGEKLIISWLQMLQSVCYFLQEFFLELKDKIHTSVAPPPSLAFATQIFNFLINCPTSPLGLYVSYCSSQVFFTFIIIFYPQNLAEYPAHSRQSINIEKNRGGLSGTEKVVPKHSKVNMYCFYNVNELSEWNSAKNIFKCRTSKNNY